MNEVPDLVAIGKIVGVFGIAGEMKIAPMTSSPDRFTRGLRVWIGPDPTTRTRTSISEVRIKGKHIVIRLEGIATREEAEKHKQEYLLVDQTERVRLPANSWFISDIIGLEVVDEDGTAIGTISDVLQLPAHHVYAIRQGKKEILIPAIPSVVLKVDLTERKMIVHLMEGLLDL